MSCNTLWMPEVSLFPVGFYSLIIGIFKRDNKCKLYFYIPSDKNLYSILFGVFLMLTFFGGFLKIFFFKDPSSFSYFVAMILEPYTFLVTVFV